MWVAAAASSNGGQCQGTNGDAQPSAAAAPPMQHARPGQVAAGTALGVALQVALGAPFLLAYPYSYLTRAFEFSRVRLRLFYNLPLVFHLPPEAGAGHFCCPSRHIL